MIGTTWVLQVAILVSPTGLGETGQQQESTSPRPPAVLHVSRDTPQLVPVGSNAPVPETQATAPGPQFSGPQLGRDMLERPIIQPRPPAPIASQSQVPVQSRPSLIEARPASPEPQLPVQRDQAASDSAAPPRILFDSSPIGSGVREQPVREIARRPTTSRANRAIPPNGGSTTNQTRSQITDGNRSRPATGAEASSLQLVLAGEDRFRVSDEREFQLIVVNHSERVVSDITLQLQSDSGFAITVLDRHASIDARRGVTQWTIPAIAPGDHTVIRFKAVATRTGTMVHRLVAVTSDGETAEARFSSIATSR